MSGRPDSAFLRTFISEARFLRSRILSYADGFVAAREGERSSRDHGTARSVRPRDFSDTGRPRNGENFAIGVERSEPDAERESCHERVVEPFRGRAVGAHGISECAPVTFTSHHPDSRAHRFVAGSRSRPSPTRWPSRGGSAISPNLQYLTTNAQEADIGRVHGLDLKASHV
jgi:hypothetical protein